MPRIEEKRKKGMWGTRMVKGLDVGTAFIYGAQKNEGGPITYRTQRNAFFDIEYSDFTKEILKRCNVRYVRKGNRFFIVGDEALKLANVFGKNTRRPLRSGVISAIEPDAFLVIESIIKNVLGEHRHTGELVYFSVPGEAVDADFDTIYHENVIKRLLSSWEYTPKPINEGLAVIYSELAKDNFTGIGISFGGGMANVCFANMSIPVFSFSVARAGDWIDEQVARVTNQTVSKITAIKESGLDLTKPEESLTKIEQAFSIYYNHLIEYVLSQIKREIEKLRVIPKLEKPIPIVIAGGTAKPKGFLQKFNEALKKMDFSIKIGEVKLASNPLQSIVKGCLIAAIADHS